MDDSKGMLGGAGHSALKGGEVGGDAIDMEVNEGLLAFGAEEEVAVVVVQGAESGSDAVRLRFSGFSAVEICPQLCIQSRTFRPGRRGT